MNSLDNACLKIAFVIGRFAVPLFFIISGYLSFPVKDGRAFPYLKKRLLRIVLPLLIWLVVYTICFGHTDSLVYDFTHATQAPQLWYLYALIGITLLIPLTSNFICSSTKAELQFYILVWCLTLIFNGNFLDEFLRFETNHNGMLFTNPISALINFYGFFGYFLVGAYLRRFEVGKYVPLTFALAGCGLAMVLLAVSNVPIDKIIAYNSIVNLLLSSSIFILAKRALTKIDVKDSTYKTICHLGSLTFGVYLCHWLFFQLLYMAVPESKSWNCVISSAVVLLLSFIVTYAIAKLPFKKYIIG